MTIYDRTIRSLKTMAWFFDQNVGYNDLIGQLYILLKNPDLKIIGLGAGRMGYSLRAFIMRLGHMGFNATMIGDTNVPSADENTLVIVNSSSGETPSIILLAKKAKQNGAFILTFTIHTGSTLGSMADMTMAYGAVMTAQPMKTFYEQYTYIMFDCICQDLMSILDISEEDLTHTNLE